MKVSSFETRVLAAFIASVMLMLGLVVATWRVAQDAAVAGRMVSQSHEVINALALTRADTIEAEWATQAYRVSGEVARLLERDNAVANREARLERVARLLAPGAGQEARFAALRRVIDERRAISRQVESLRQTKGVEAATAFAAQAPLQLTRERTYTLLLEMSGEEQRQLERRESMQLQTQAALTATASAAAGFLCLLLAGVYVLIRRQMRETEASHLALAQSEERLSATLHSIGDAVLSTDTAGLVTDMNPVAETLTGWLAGDAVGRPVADIMRVIDEKTRQPIPLPVSAVLQTGEARLLADQTTLVARNGAECPIADSAAPIRDSSGQITGVVLVFRDETLVRIAQRSVHEQNALLESRVRERTMQLRLSEDHLSKVINNVPALIAYVDANQRYVYVNRQYQDRFAPGKAGLTGLSVSEVLGPERYAIASPMIRRTLSGQPQTFDWQPFPGVWQVIDYVPRRDEHGDVDGYYVLGMDITQRKLAEERIQTLYTSLERNMAGLEHSRRALKTLSAGNRALVRATTEKELLDSMCGAIVHDGGYPMSLVWYADGASLTTLRSVASVGNADNLQALHRLKATWADNEKVRGVVANSLRTAEVCVVRDIRLDDDYASWQALLPGIGSCIACPLRVGEAVIGTLAIYSAETFAVDEDEEKLLVELADDLAFGIANLRANVDQQRIKEAMQRLARYDTLTGLPNEAQFVERLAVAIESGQQTGQPFAIVQTNVERLNEINDALGFVHGDHLLQEFGARLKGTAPIAAFTARLRGDEFAMLMPGQGLTVAMEQIQRIADALKPPFQIADISINVSVKIGVVVYPDHGSTPHELLRHVDMALNHAKRRATLHSVFSAEQDKGQSDKLAIAGELRKAIENGDLRLYLQPKVNIANGQVCGAEGLVRWHHAERGLLAPGEFIGLAEHTGLIGPLTEWVIEAGLCLIQAWAAQGNALPVALNLSARNLRDEHLLEKIRKIRTSRQVGPGLLELEVTESSVMDDPEYALKVLRALRDEGIPLAIDDFGTGYSSLIYLQKLPVEYIKIDQYFVQDMVINPNSATIVRSTIDLIHDLGRVAVAEGVETQRQWSMLASFGCDIAQGYFLARPMPAEEWPAWMARYRPPASGSS